MLLGRFFLVIALLAGSQAALVHPLEHVDEHGALVHLEDGKGDGKASGEPCDAIAALGYVAAVVQVHTAVGAAAVSFAPLDVAAPWLAQAPPFLSQGPPAVL